MKANGKSEHGKVMNDEQLLKEAREGDPDACSAIFYRLSDLVFRICMTYAGGDRETAKDLTQIVFMKLFEKLDDIGPPYNLKAWSRKAAHNVGIDYVRSQRSGEETMLKISAGGFNLPANPEERAIKAELQKAVRETMNKEPEGPVKETAMLFYMSDKDIAEIADEQGITRTAVTTRLARFRTRIKKVLLKKITGEENE